MRMAAPSGEALVGALPAADEPGDVAGGKSVRALPAEPPGAPDDVEAGAVPAQALTTRLRPASTLTSRDDERTLDGTGYPFLSSQNPTIRGAATPEQRAVDEPPIRARTLPGGPLQY